MDNNVPDLSGMFEMLTKNPEMLKKASEMLSGMSGGKAESVGNAHETPPDAQGEERRGAREEHEENRGAKLLDALKPYLSPSRRRAVDSIKQFEHMGEIMKLLGMKGGGDNV